MSSEKNERSKGYGFEPALPHTTTAIHGPINASIERIVAPGTIAGSWTKAVFGPSEFVFFGEKAEACFEAACRAYIARLDEQRGGGR